MILDLVLVIQRQSYKAVDRFCEMHEAGGVFLLHFEDDLVWVGGAIGDDFGGEGAGGGHYFGDAWWRVLDLRLGVGVAETFSGVRRWCKIEVVNLPYHCPAILYRVSQ